MSWCASSATLAASIIQSRAIEFVKDAYREAGVDLNDVQTGYLFSEGLTMLAYALFSALCAILAAYNASKTAAVVARDLRHDLYARVLSFAPAEMEKFSAASLITPRHQRYPADSDGARDVPAHRALCPVHGARRGGARALHAYGP